MTLTIPTPPPDNSGGFLILQYTNGTRLHKMRVHLIPFIPGGGASVPYVTPPGTEHSINDTFFALASLMAPYFTSAWSISGAALYQMVSGVPTEVFPVPTSGAVVGTAAGSDATGEVPAGEMIFNFKSTLGNRAKLIIIGSSQWAANAPAIVTTTTGGAARDQAMVAYLTGVNTAIVAHDGSKFTGNAHLTYPLNKRLRKHYQYA